MKQLSAALTLLALQIVSTSSALAQVPVVNLPSSITEEQERRFFNDSIWVRCESEATEERKYKFTTRPVLDGSYEYQKTELDVSAWISVPNFDEKMEAMSSAEFTKTETKDGSVIARTDQGRIVFSRQKGGTLQALFDHGGETGIRMSCQPRLITCQSAPNSVPFFFLKLQLPSEDQSTVVDVTYDIDPWGDKSLVTGHASSSGTGTSSSIGVDLKLPELKGSLRINHANGRFTGQFKMFDAAFKQDLEDMKLICRMGM